MSAEVEIHDAELRDVAYERLRDRQVRWVLEIQRQGCTIGQRNDDAVGQATCSVRVAPPALDGADRGHEVCQRLHGAHMSLDPVLAHVVVEPEPGDVFRGHAVPLCDSSSSSTSSRMASILTRQPFGGRLEALVAAAEPPAAT